MCKLIEDMRKEEREEGREEGRKEGVFALIDTLKEFNVPMRKSSTVSARNLVSICLPQTNM